MMLSLYTFLFQEDNIYYLYNSQSGFFSEIDKSFFEILCDRRFEEVPTDILKVLIENKIIVEESQKYSYYYETYMRNNCKNYNPFTMGLVLVPTTICNFRCPYCFEPHKDTAKIDSKTIESIIKFVKSHEELRKINLTWYGGEPLIAINEIYSILSKLHEPNMPEIDSHSIITNGYLFDDDAIMVFKEFPLNDIQITLDGISKHHDKIRCLKNGEPTYDVIMSNIRKILRTLTQTNVQIRVNVDKNNWKEFITLYEELHSLLEEHSNLSIYPGLIRHDTPDGRSLCAKSFSCTELSILYRKIESRGISTRSFPRRSHKGCMVHSLYSYIIGPKGEIYKCWNDVGSSDRIVGNIDDDNLNKSDLFLDYLIGTLPFNQECKDCLVFPICDGGCSYHRYKNLKKNCFYPLCSTFKDPNNLKYALLSNDPLFDISNNELNC